MEFPVLQTSRLFLRQVMASDAPVVLAGYSNPDVYRHMSVAYHSLEEVQVQLDWYDDLWEQKKGIWWGFCLADSGVMIGNGGFHLWNKEHSSAEIGYWLLPQYQGRGLASEALQAMVRCGTEQLHLHRIEAVVERDNTASSSLLGRNGFTLEGIKRQCERKNTDFIDLEIWSVLETDNK